MFLAIPKCTILAHLRNVPGSVALRICIGWGLTGATYEVRCRLIPSMFNYKCDATE